MKTTLGGPPQVKTALDTGLRELEQRRAEVDTAKTTAEQRNIDAEAQAVVDKSAFKWGDLLPWRWGRLFASKPDFQETFDRLSSARKEDVDRAIAELKKIDAVTQPFRQLCASLGALQNGTQIGGLELGAAQVERDQRTQALGTITALRAALDAAGECEATKTFPLGQLQAIELALRGDVAALKEQIDFKQQRHVPGLERAVEQFIVDQQRQRDQPPVVRQEPPPVVKHEPPVVKHEPPVVKHEPPVVKHEPVRQAAPVEERPAVEDKKGALSHRGSPVQFGAEKEFSLKRLGEGGGDKFAHTRVDNFDRTLMKDVLRPNMLVEAAQGKTADQIQWSDLNDLGKSTYATEYSKKHTTDKGKPKWPVLRVNPNDQYANVSTEPTGDFEVISKKFDSVREANVFLEEFGYGHIHTTWMRGAPREEQLAQTAWVRNANMWMFLDALENRGASMNGESFWRFAIKGLSIPTEDHLGLALQMIQHRDMSATAFSKHLLVNMRSSGKYGERNRIGVETRGGDVTQKQRVLDSLLNGLTQKKWGSEPDRWGEGSFKLVSVGSTGEQVKSLPREFESLAEKHLREHKTGDLTAADAGRLYRMVANATFYPDYTRAARINAFDQRACTPLLNFEAITWLSDGEKKRAIEARGRFLIALDKLSKEELPNHERGHKIAELIVNWARDARLGSAFGRWLDGGERQHFFS